MILLTDEVLREIENHITNSIGSNYLRIFNRKKDVFGPKENGKIPDNEKHEFGEVKRNFDNKIKKSWDFESTIFNKINNLMERFNFSDKLKSVRFTLDFLTPLSFFIAWLIILLITSTQLSYLYSCVIVLIL